MSKITFADVIDNNYTVTHNGETYEVEITRDEGAVITAGTQLNAETLNEAFSANQDKLIAGKNVKIEENEISFVNEYMPGTLISESPKASSHYAYNKDEWEMETKNVETIVNGGIYLASLSEANNCVVEFELENIHLIDADSDPTVLVRFKKDATTMVHCLFRLKKAGIRLVDYNWNHIDGITDLGELLPEPVLNEVVTVKVIRLSDEFGQDEYSFYYNEQYLGKIATEALGLTTVAIGTVGCKADKIKRWKLDYMN